MRKLLILSFLLFFTIQLQHDGIPEQIVKKERVMRFTIYPRDYHAKKIEQILTNIEKE